MTTQVTDELSAYRDGYEDALAWALENLDLDDVDADRLNEILNAPDVEETR